MTRDRIKYEVCHRLWCWWHIRIRRFFDRMSPEPGVKRGYAMWVVRSRPWWHLCCNGDAGGWRTGVCDFLESRWRDTDHYEPNRYKPGKEIK